jgi:hypothetical protein
MLIILLHSETKHSGHLSRKFSVAKETKSVHISNDGEMQKVSLILKPLLPGAIESHENKKRRRRTERMLPKAPYIAFLFFIDVVRC